MEDKNEKVENEIMAIIRREQDRTFWRRMKFTLGKQLGGSMATVQVQDEAGDTIE